MQRDLDYLKMCGKKYSYICIDQDGLLLQADVLIKEENLVAAYDLIKHFCESIIGRFPIIESQR
jgi:transposase-like protein